MLLLLFALLKPRMNEHLIVLQWTLFFFFYFFGFWFFLNEWNRTLRNWTGIAGRFLIPRHTHERERERKFNEWKHSNSIHECVWCRWRLISSHRIISFIRRFTVEMSLIHWQDANTSDTEWRGRFPFMRELPIRFVSVSVNIGQPLCVTLHLIRMQSWW